MQCIFSVDVEDWFHILDLPSTPDLGEWDALPSRVERNFLKLLDLFDECKVRVTCFFLGWVGERFPNLVREANTRGHEIGSHGYAHQLVYRMSREEFGQDAKKSKKVLEDVVGAPVVGYRSAGFSVTESTPWFFDALTEAGYRYDSSVFPAPRQHGGLNGGRCAPYRLAQDAESMVEFPITVVTLLGKRMCFFGGGYLRLFPYHLIRRMARKVLAEERPVVFYVHPREIDPDQPRLPMDWVRRIKSYVNLETTEPKIRRLLDDFEVTTFKDFMADHSFLVGDSHAE